MSAYNAESRIDTTTKVCPDCGSGNVHPDGCCGNMACVECGEAFKRWEMASPGDFIDAAEILRGQER